MEANERMTDLTITNNPYYELENLKSGDRQRLYIAGWPARI